MAANDDPNFQFRITVADAAQRLTADNRERLVFLYQLPPDDKEKSGLSILANLQMRGEFSFENPETLVDVMKACYRPDIAKDVAKDVEKQKKRRKGKDREKKGKPTPGPVQALKEKTDWLKARFDEIVEQAAQLVDQVAKLREQIEKEGEGHHQGANHMLIRCEEEANKLQRSLRHARSAGKLSDHALQLQTGIELQKQINAAVQKVPVPMREKVEDMLRSSTVESPPSHIATPGRSKLPVEESRKKPLLPPQAKPAPCAPKATDQEDQEPECSYYESCDLLQDKPHLKATPTGSPEAKRRSIKGPVPTPRNGTQRKQSDANPPPSRIPIATHRHKKSSSRRLSEGSENLYMNARMENQASSDSDYTGSGGTGDSGFGDTTPFLREPLKKPHKYTPLLPEHRETCEEALYDTLY